MGDFGQTNQLKQKLPNFICRSQFQRFYLFLQNILKVKITDCKTHKTDSV